MLKVYIADDEAWIVSLLRNILPWKDLGFRIVGSSSLAGEAVKQIRILNPDIVLTDIRMPGLSGLELIEALGGAASKTEFIVISGHDEFAYAREALNKRVTAYLLKPVDEVELASVLRDAQCRILEKRETEQRHTDDRVRMEKLARVLSHDEPEGEEAPEGMDPRISKAVGIISREYRNDLSLTDLAARVFMSECYFSDCFKKETGRTFSDFLSGFRIEKSLTLLERRELKIHDVAAMCGYRNPNYFCRVFKRIHGISPSEYRRKAR